MNQFGLNQKHTDLIQTVFKELLDTNQSLSVWVFGSRATHSHKPFSDVDLLIRATPPLTASQLSKLRENLEDSTLPFKFDLVLEEKVYPPFVEKINSEKKLFFELLPK